MYGRRPRFRAFRSPFHRRFYADRRSGGHAEAMSDPGLRLVPRVLRLERLGHKRSSTDERYSHATGAMISRMLEQLQRRWEVDGGWSWTAEGPDEAE